jgi:hypothetical protein
MFIDRLPIKTAALVVAFSDFPLAGIPSGFSPGRFYHRRGIGS